jgi:inositol phosphorylceramide synthase catalytic subunit
MNTGKIAVTKNGRTSVVVVPLIVAAMLGFFAVTTGLRPDHFLLVTIILACYYISGATRRLITGLSVFIVYWMIYDSMKAWPNWAFTGVDILPLYNAEKALFGINHGGVVLTPNEYLILHSRTALDIIGGAFYLCWVPVPLLFAFYLYAGYKELFLRFSLAFLTVNCIGFIIYYTHPAAPPWYFAEYGNVLDVNTKSNAAGLLKFDSYFGVTLFEDLYRKGSNVFAAMPSLHASYPLIAFIYSLRQKRKWISVFLAIVMTGIWTAAIYLNHHYILDVIAGIACAFAGIFLLERVILRTSAGSSFLKAFTEKITSP